MPTSKDSPDAASLGPRRMSFGSTMGAQPSRAPHQHSASLSALNTQHRINRRKSSSAAVGINLTALAEVAREASSGGTSTKQRSRPNSQGDMLARPMSVKSSVSTPTGAKTDRSSVQTPRGSTAVIDGPPLAVLSNEKASQKARIRRASEGNRLTRPEQRRATTGELRCETCGKSYKHGSCLTKHLWEHTPEWNLTSKLLISKHQQVQLLEAASVLVNMGHESGTSAVNESAVQDSDLSSDSPAASGPWDLQNDEMSSRTSSPSQEDVLGERPKSSRRQFRQDSYSSVFTSHRSSAYSLASSAPNDATDMSYYRPWTVQRRPSTAGMSNASSYVDNDEQSDVAAAAESLISCSLGTPSHGPTVLPPDVPPVPPLPAKFLKQTPNQSVMVAEVDMVDAEPKGPIIRSREVDEEYGFFGRMDQ